MKIVLNKLRAFLVRRFSLLKLNFSFDFFILKIYFGKIGSFFQRVLMMIRYRLSPFIKILIDDNMHKQKAIDSLLFEYKKLYAHFCYLETYHKKLNGESIVDDMTIDHIINNKK